MAQFKFMNELNSMMNMDGEISKGAVPRYQRKLLESSAASMSLNASINSSKHKLSVSYNGYASAISSATNNKTPNKNTMDASKKKTPNGKSPGNQFIRYFNITGS